MFNFLNRRKSGDSLPYANLKDGFAIPSRSPWPKRYNRLAVAGLVLLCISVYSLCWGFANSDSQGSASERHSVLPPLYPKLQQQELHLPQHNPNLPFPEGRTGKYLWMPNHVKYSGWGNVMQEHILNSFLAYKTGRALVFDNYTWNDDGSLYSDYKGHMIPSQIPLTAFIGGPAGAGPFPANDPSPRFVKPQYFYEVCPEPVIINNEDTIRHLDPEASVATLVQTWVDKFSQSDRCVEIDRNSFHLFGIWVFGSAKRLLDIWPLLSVSPILQNFEWSPLVRAGFDANRGVFSSASRLYNWLPTRKTPDALPGLLALHVRRGDFVEHCINLATWRTPYMGFNSFPSLPDKFTPPPEEMSIEDRTAFYEKVCFPSIEQIVKRVQEVRATPVAQGLRDIFIMTNGPGDWVDELKASLRETGGWDQITSGRDLSFTWEQQYVRQTVDMMIAERAQVLIGNGFSSLTSNVVMLRMAKKITPESNRFW